MPRPILTASFALLSAAPLVAQSPTACHSPMLDFAPLEPPSDSFLVLLQGAARGWQRSELRPAGDPESSRWRSPAPTAHGGSSGTPGPAAPPRSIASSEEDRR